MNRNLSATCVCPKACNIVLYKAFMSYAASKQNNEHRMRLPEDVLMRVGKHLNESLDSREYIEPEKRIVNIQEAERVLRFLPPDPKVINSEFEINIYDISQLYLKRLRDYNRLVAFIEKLGFQDMKKVLENDFIAVWKRMNFYDHLMPEYILHLEALSDSIDMIDNKLWRAGLLKLRHDLLKRTLYNLDRVHAAYHNAVPLANNKVTPNGRYDAIYLTKELFIHKPEINETYTRLNGHIRKYKKQIDGMFRMNVTDCHVTDTRNNCISHSNGFWRVSADYERDLRLYESLVIKQPFHRLNSEIERWKSLKNRMVGSDLQSLTNKCHDSNSKMIRCSFAYKNTRMTYTIENYLDDLRKGKRTSKLHIARQFNAYNVLQLIDNFTQLVLTNREDMQALIFHKSSFEWKICILPRLVRNDLPILPAWYLKMYHYINRATGTDKSAMEYYFMIHNHQSPQARMVHESTTSPMCYKPSHRNFHVSSTASSRQVTSYKKMLDTLLHKTQLDGTLFRYVLFDLDIYIIILRPIYFTSFLCILFGNFL